MTPNKNLPLIDWQSIEASAPGKFIISGEYAVVYEKQAIATTIDLKTKVTIRPNNEGKVRLFLKNFNDIREWPVTSLTMCRLVTKYLDILDYEENMAMKLDLFLDFRYRQEDTDLSPDDLKKANDATMAFLLLYISIGDSYFTSSRPPIDVEIESDIPVGAGLGSSSALSVALVGALLKVFRVSAERYIISKWAFNIDKFFHGRPSGVDNNIITNGGFILFQSGKIKATCIQHKIPLKVLLIDTCVSRSTKSMAVIISDLLRDDPTRAESIFNNINQLTTRIWRELNDVSFVPSNIAVDLQANQEQLDRLGVGHEKLTDICLRAQRLNLVAKQTGAGGGGAAFVLYNNTDDSDNITQLRNELIASGYKVRDHSIGCDGLQVSVKQDVDNTKRA